MEFERISAEHSAPIEPMAQIHMRWMAVAEAAKAAAQLAGLDERQAPFHLTDLSDRLHRAAPWRRELALNCIDDTTAAIEPGLGALLVAVSRGRKAQAAGLTLWQEFDKAQNQLIQLLATDSDNRGRSRLG